MASHLAVEIAEMQTVKQSKSEAEFNAWYDKSAIKARHKKSCMREQGLRCCYCQKFLELPYNNIWDLEHILAEQHYPQFFTAEGNLSVACKSCNGAKSDKDVLRADYARPPAALPSLVTDYTIPHPHLTSWNDHLVHTNYIVYEGKSDQGKMLVTVCKLQDPGLAKAGMTQDMLEAAISTAFFSIIKPYVTLEENVPQQAALLAMAEIQNFQENQRRDIALQKLNNALERLERAAIKRAAKIA